MKAFIYFSFYWLVNSCERYNVLALKEFRGMISPIHKKSLHFQINYRVILYNIHFKREWKILFGTITFLLNAR